MYVAWRPKYSNFYLNSYYKIFATRIQSDNTFKQFSKCLFLGIYTLRMCLHFLGQENWRNICYIKYFLSIYIFFHDLFLIKYRLYYIILLWIICASSMWKFPVNIFVASNLGSTVVQCANAILTGHNQSLFSMAFTHIFCADVF